MSAELIRLKQEIKACRLCEPALPLGANPVVRFSKTAKILIAGQAPGTRVHKTSIPFNDPSGDRLRLWMGINHENFYDENRIAIVPMGFCYPGKGSSGDLPPRSECAATWHKKLLEKLSQVELTLAIGQYAIRYHLQRFGYTPSRALTQTVQRWQEFLPRLLVLPHPSPRNNLWLRRNPWFEQQLVPEIQTRVSAILGYT